MRAELLCILGAACQAASPEALIEGGHYRAARAALVGQSGERPADPRAASLLASTLEMAGEVDAAIKLMESAAAADPGNADYHSRLASLYGRMAQKAGIFKGLGLIKKFRKETDAALALNPKHSNSLYMLAMFYWEAPGFIGGDKTKARSTAELLAKADPVRGNLLRAELALKRNSPGEAETFYRKAAEANPNPYGAHMQWARFHLDPAHRSVEQAETHARAALALDTNRVAAYTTLAGILAETQRLRELEALLTQAEERVPDNLSPYFMAARALLAKGRHLDLAEAFIAKYASREPEYAAPSKAQAATLLARVRARVQETRRK